MGEGDSKAPGWGMIILIMVVTGIGIGLLLGLLGSVLGLSSGATAAGIGGGIGAVGALLIGRRRAAQKGS